MGKNESRDGVVPLCVFMDSNIATQRKGAGGKKLRIDSFEKCISKIFTPAVVLEELSNESSNELSNEMVPDLPNFSLKVEDETPGLL